MSSTRVSERMKQRDKVHGVRFQVPENYTYKDALNELHNAHKSKNKDALETAFFRLAFSLKKNQLTEAIGKRADYPYPEIDLLLHNLKNWYERFDIEHKKYFDDLILDTKEYFLYMTVELHQNCMANAAVSLNKLTGLDWSFDGIELVSSPNNDWREENPARPKKCANKIMDVLIARKILSGRYDDIKYSSSSINTSDYRWHCQVVNLEELYKMNREVILTEIREASILISQITGKNCHILELYPVESGDHYKVMEQIGCIKIKEYNICDYDIAKLRRLCAENKTIKDIWAAVESENKSPHEPISISYHIGTGTEVSTISFWNIASMEKMQKLKSISINSGFLFNAFGEDERMSLSCAINNHTLMIYLPHHDEKFNNYGNFGYLFSHAKYIKWKSCILEHFPELKEEFPRFENQAMKSQQLYRVNNTLRSYHEQFRNDDPHKLMNHSRDIAEKIEALEKLREELQCELHPKYAQYRRAKK